MKTQLIHNDKIFSRDKVAKILANLYRTDKKVDAPSELSKKYPKLHNYFYGFLEKTDSGWSGFNKLISSQEYRHEIVAELLQDILDFHPSTKLRISINFVNALLTILNRDEGELEENADRDRETLMFSFYVEFSDQIADVFEDALKEFEDEEDPFEEKDYDENYDEDC
jgi:hypothetical protein